MAVAWGGSGVFPGGGGGGTGGSGTPGGSNTQVQFNNSGAFDGDAGLTFIVATGELSATTFSGAGTGLTGTASGLSIGGNAATADDGLTSATGTTPLNLSLVAKALTGSVDVMTGCDEANPGLTGTVPAPAAGNQANFLRGDGTWASASAAPGGYTAKGDENYNVAATDDVIGYTLTGTDRTVTLPAAATAGAGKRFTVIKLDTTQSLLTIAPSGSEKISGATAFYLTLPNYPVQVMSDGSNYVLLSPVRNAKGVIIARATGIDFNSTADQPLRITGLAGARVSIAAMTLTNASISLNTAVGGAYSAASKGGTALYSSSTTYSSLSAPTKYLTVTAITAAAADGSLLQTGGTIYFSLTTAQGAPATADVAIGANVEFGP